MGEFRFWISRDGPIVTSHFVVFASVYRTVHRHAPLSVTRGVGTSNNKQREQTMDEGRIMK